MAWNGTPKKTDKEYEYGLTGGSVSMDGTVRSTGPKQRKEADMKASRDRQDKIKKEVYDPRRKANSVARAGQLAAEKMKAKKAKQAKRSTMEKDMSERGIPKKDVAGMKQIN